MKLNIRGKLFAVSLGLIGVSLLASELYLRPAVEANLLERIRDDLFARLSLVEQAARGQTDLERAHWDALADELGPRARGRVTFIGADGVVLGDSQVSLEGLAQRREPPRPPRGGGGAGGGRTVVDPQQRHGARTADVRGGSAGAARRRARRGPSGRPARRGRCRRQQAAPHLVGGAGAGAHRGGGALQRRRADAFARARPHDRGGAADGRPAISAVRTRPSGTDEIAELGRALDAMAGNLATSLTALRTERDLLEVILQSMQEGVLVLDQDSRMLLVNPALRATFSLGPDAEGRAALELIRNAELQSILERARKGSGAVTGEIEITGPKPRRLLVHAASLPPLNAKSQGLLAVFVDVSEIRRLETLRKDFVANVSHELRTPITAVRSAVDTLRLTLERDPGASDRFVDIIDRNAQRLGALVEDLLDLSRIESKEYRPDAAPVSLRGVSEQVLSLLRPRIEEKSFDVVNEIPGELPAGPRRSQGGRAGVHQPARQRHQVLRRRAPRFACARSGPGIALRVEIADSGPGIEPRHLPRLFERFYRVDSGRSRDMGGTGLGLSIVKHLVEAMGGTIGVESIPGRGATFWFTLPVG